MQLSSKVKNVKESPTLRLDARAKGMISDGEDVVNLTAGEPDFDTPKNVKDAAKEAIESGFTKYTHVSGIPELKEAIAEKLKKENGLSYSPEEIIVSSGGKQSLYNAFQAICNPGDEVIIPVPYWVSYAEQVTLCDAKPVFVETREENGFELLSEDVERKVSEKTKAMLLNSPCNPTGAVFSGKEMKRIAEIAVENDLSVVSDEIYEKLVYDCEHVSIAAFGRKIRERAIIINGASKAYAMTGWRLGWAAGPPGIVKGMANFQSQTTSNPNSIAQKAYLAAITQSQESMVPMLTEFRKRRDFVVKRLNEIEGMRCVNPKGAFYVFPNVSKFFGGDIKNSMDFCERLLGKEKVATVPGSAFGGEGFVRLSYASSIENLEEGLGRIERFVRGL